MIWHNIDSKIAQCKTDKDYSSTHRYSALFHLGGNHFVSLGQADDSLHMYPLGCYFPVFYYNFSGELSAAFHCTRSIDLDILTSKEVLDHDPSVCHYGVAWSKHSIILSLRRLLLSIICLSLVAPPYEGDTYVTRPRGLMPIIVFKVLALLYML